jgi:aminoglycoside phosphotransferase (APT) family kinase protein
MADATAFDPRFTGTEEVREKHRFDEARLRDYLEQNLDGYAGPMEIRQFKGGQSNPTYQLVTPAARYVLRRKPPGKLLKSAHAVDREFRVISALNTIDFEVPRAHLLCEDDGVIGTAFYVMEFVEGRVIWDSAMPGFEPAERRAVYESLYDVLARLHLASVEDLDLSTFGRPGNYFARQISRWSKQYIASETEKIPEMDHLTKWLPENIPAGDTTCVVHGDYKLDNTVVHPTEPRVIAVLDWEISTLGDPLGDLTYFISQRFNPGSPFEGLDDAALTALGIPTIDELIDNYCTQVGRERVDNVDFYIAYNIYRSGCILQGILGRVRDGTAASAHAGSHGSVRALGERAMEFAARLGA